MKTNERGFITQEIAITLTVGAMIAAAGVYGTDMYLGWQRVLSTKQQMHTISKVALADAAATTIFATSYTDLRSRHPGLPLRSPIESTYTLRGDMYFAAVGTTFSAGTFQADHDYYDAYFANVPASNVWEMTLTGDYEANRGSETITNPELNSWVDVW